MERIAMSQEERDELNWLKQAQNGSIAPRAGAERMGVSERWVHKLLKSMKRKATGLWCMGYGENPPIVKSRSRREDKHWLF
jgi:hypothetical protein